MLDYYQHTAAHLTRHPRPDATPAALPGAASGLANRNQALAWLRTERANLLACLEHATQHVQHARVVRLTAGVASLLRSSGPWTQALGLYSQAAAAARHLGDRHDEANALTELGDMWRLSGDYVGAAQVVEQALGLCRDLGNPNGEARALSKLGVGRGVSGDYAGAAQVLKQALGHYRDLGDRNGEAEVLNHSGTVCLKSGIRSRRWPTTSVPWSLPA